MTEKVYSSFSKLILAFCRANLLWSLSKHICSFLHFELDYACVMNYTLQGKILL